MTEIQNIKKCQCGAVIIETENETYPMSEKYFNEHFTDLKIPEGEPDYIHCDYCINNFGLNLCACGSGEEYDECDNGYDECGKPMMTYGEIKPRGAWG